MRARHNRPSSQRCARAARSRRLKIKYRIFDPPFRGLDDPGLVFWARPDGLYPDEGSDPDYVSEVNRDKFLSTKISKIRSQYLTVQDIIKYAANVLGAVHRRKPRQDRIEEIAISELAKSVNILSIELPLYQLHSLSKITLESLTPLYEKITSTYARA